jgi:hypothetical protein
MQHGAGDLGKSQNVMNMVMFLERGTYRASLL